MNRASRESRPMVVVAAKMPSSERDVLFRAATERGISASRLIRCLVQKELGLTDEARVVDK